MGVGVQILDSLPVALGQTDLHEDRVGFNVDPHWAAQVLFPEPGGATDVEERVGFGI
jgi:hypothetical protein